MTSDPDPKFLNIFSPQPTFDSPPTPPIPPDSGTHILDKQDFENFSQFLEGFDKDTMSLQTPRASTESLPPRLLAFSAPAPQPITEASSVLYSDHAYSHSQTSIYNLDEGQGVAPTHGSYWNGSMPGQNRSEQPFHHVPADDTSCNVAPVPNATETNPEHHWVPTSLNGVRQSNPATPPNLNGYSVPKHPGLNFPQGEELMQHFYNAFSQPQRIHNGIITPKIFPYGSDSGFQDARFISPATQEAAVQRNELMTETLSCLKPSNSATSTCPSSPAIRRRKLPVEVDEAEQELPSRTGRRKSKAKVNRVCENNLNEDQQPSVEKDILPPAKRTRVTKKADIDRYSDAGRSCSEGRKGPRKNLTEEQKKQNHIESEQRRRDDIKAAYDTLPDIIPGFDPTKPRANRLEQAVKWLEQLIDGNRELKKRLSAA